MKFTEANLISIYAETKEGFKYLIFFYSNYIPRYKRSKSFIIHVLNNLIT